MLRSSFFQERTAITTEPRITKDCTPNFHWIALYLDEQYCVGKLHLVRESAWKRLTNWTECRNLSVLTALNGEPGWVCLLCCNCDGLYLLATDAIGKKYLTRTDLKYFSPQ